MERDLPGMPGQESRLSELQARQMLGVARYEIYKTLPVLLHGADGQRQAAGLGGEGGSFTIWKKQSKRR